MIKQFGEQIRQTIDEMLRALDVRQGLIIVEDKGALDCVIRARLQSAILRAAEEQTVDWRKCNDYTPSQHAVSARRERRHALYRIYLPT